MTIFFNDNFEIYDTVRTSGDMDSTWLNRQYTVKQTAATGLRIRNSTATVPYSRVILSNAQAFTGTRSVYKHVGQYLTGGNDRICIGQKLVDYTPSGNAIGGISHVTSTTDDHILSFGFMNVSEGFVRYVDVDGYVRQEVFILPTALSRNYDTIEWTFIKDSTNREDYRGFSLWVNNRPAYSGNIFCQIGSTSTLHARILGGVNTLAPNVLSPNGYLNAGGNISVPQYGTTDLIIADSRLGRTRTSSRLPIGDAGPNTMSPSEGGVGHYELVNSVPPTSTSYLTAITSAGQEVFNSGAFDDLSSERILAVALKVASYKNDPSGFDVTGIVRLGAQTHITESAAVNLTPGFQNIIIEKNPFNNLDWTPLEVNQLQFGIGVE